MKKHEEGNKVIAEFMGKAPGATHDNLAKAYGAMQYHKSWDWLMPVLGKIRNDTPFFINAAKEYTDNIEYALKQVSFDYLYGAIVDFLQWYSNEGAEQIRKENERLAGVREKITKMLDMEK